MIFPIAIHASKILGVDNDLRLRWQEVLENLVASPEGPRRFGGQGGNTRGGYGAFVYGGPGAIEPKGPEPELKSMFLNFNRTAGFIDTAGIGGSEIFRNRLRLREGPGAIDAEHISGLTMGINSSLLTNASKNVDEEPIIYVFPSWPKDWDAEFKLLARDGFLVSSSQRKSEIEFVEINSQLGQECKLQNPWGNEKVTLYRNGSKAETIGGAFLKFNTAKGENIVVVKSGSSIGELKRKVI